MLRTSPTSTAKGRGAETKENLWHNEALQCLDCIVAGSVEEPARNAPPSSPTPGQAYLVGSAPEGEWSQYPDHIAAFGEGGWRFVAPVAGLCVFDRSTEMVVAYRSGGWEAGIVRASTMVINGQQVVGPQAGPIADPAGGANIDAEARSAITEMLTALRQHGLISA